MSTISFPNIDGYRGDGSTGSDTCESFTHGDTASRYVWDLGWNASFRALNWLLGGVTNGQLLIGKTSTGRFVKATPTAANGITVTTGAGTLAFGMSANGYIKSQEINLALGSSATYELFSPDVACTIVSAYLIFSVAAGSVAASIDIGNSGGTSTTYFTGSSNAGGALFDKQSLTMLTSTIAANSTVYLTTDGAADAGKAVLYLKFKVS